MSQTEALIIPATDADTAGFFEAAGEGRLAVWACTACETLSFPRRHLCPQCRGGEGEWREVAPRGRVLSWTVVTHAVNPAFEAPYAVLLVAHADHPHLHFIGRVPGEPEVSFDAEVRATFDRLDDSTALVNWALV